MKNTCGKSETAVPTSKKRKGPGATPFLSTSAETRHPFLRFVTGPQEDLYQLIRARPISLGCCIDWAAMEQVRLADDVYAIIATDPWDRFFDVIEPTYMELTLEFCATFSVQQVMTSQALSLFA